MHSKRGVSALISILVVPLSACGINPGSHPAQSTMSAGPASGMTTPTQPATSTPTRTAVSSAAPAQAKTVMVSTSTVTKQLLVVPKHDGSDAGNNSSGNDNAGSSAGPCAALANQGDTYAGVVAVWAMRGRPATMDSDGNGIPCEASYRRSTVARYWASSYVTWYPSSVVTSLPRALFCKDLKQAGYSYHVALAYWLYHGCPPYMDADGDGVPCGTVY